MSPHRALVIALALVALLSSAAPAQIVSVMSTSTLVASDTTLDGSALRLESHLWRNFQPSTGIADSSLHLLLRVRAPGRELAARGLHIREIVVQSDSAAWRLTSPRMGHAEDGVIEIMARGGPAWTPGSQVDVTVELRDARGRARRLTARAQLIRRLD